LRTPFISFPPHATLGVHSHPCDTLYVIQSGEFIVDGEGSYVPGDLRWVKAGVTYGPERAGDDGAVVLIVSTDVLVLYLWRLRRRRRAQGTTQTEAVAA